VTPEELAAQQAEVDARDASAEAGGGAARLDRQRRLGRLTARERVALLLDAGSFVELGKHVLHRHEATSDLLASQRPPGDGLVCGLGAVDGRAVAVYAHDPTVLRGALGHAASQKLCRLLDLAHDRLLPVLALVDCDGVRVEEGTDAIVAYGEVIRRTLRLQGRVPQLTLLCGLCVGAAAYNAALTDLVGAVAGQGLLFITGPRVTRAVTGEEATLDQLGAAAMHAQRTGAVHAVLEGERAGIDWLKRVLACTVPRVACADSPARRVPEVGAVIPSEPRRGYDMRRVLDAVCDPGSVLELSPAFGGSLLTALARLDGRAVALVASQPQVRGGCLDVDSSRKGAAFVSLASAWGLPVVTLVDVPGYLPGRAQEEGGIIPHGATLLAAYGRARVPLICVVVRKSHGGASVLSFAADLRLALPTARVAPMAAEAMLEAVLGPPPAEEAALAQRADQRADYLARHDHAWAAAEAGYLDQVVAPEQLRASLCAGLAVLAPGARTGAP
jgi:acetyl-CoA carboxylase carboxyltransferase component